MGKEERYYLDAKLGVLARKGAGVMDGEKRGRVEVVKKRITEMYLQYSRHIHETRKRCVFLLRNMEEFQRME